MSDVENASLKQEAADELFIKLSDRARVPDFKNSDVMDLIFLGMQILELPRYNRISGPQKRQILMTTIDDLVESSLVFPFKDDYLETFMLKSIDAIAATNKNGLRNPELQEAAVVGCFALLTACFGRYPKQDAKGYEHPIKKHK